MHYLPKIFFTVTIIGGALALSLFLSGKEINSLSSSILAPGATAIPTMLMPTDTTPPEPTDLICNQDAWIFETDGDIVMHIFLRHFILQETENTVLGIHHKKYCMNMGGSLFEIDGIGANSEKIFGPFTQHVHRVFRGKKYCSPNQTSLQTFVQDEVASALAVYFNPSTPRPQGGVCLSGNWQGSYRSISLKCDLKNIVTGNNITHISTDFVNKSCGTAVSVGTKTIYPDGSFIKIDLTAGYNSGGKIFFGIPF